MNYSREDGTKFKNYNKDTKRQWSYTNNEWRIQRYNDTNEVPIINLRTLLKQESMFNLN